MIAWPKKWNSKVPSSLVGIILATVIAVVFGFDEKMALVGEIPQTLLLEDRFSFSAIDFKSIPSYISPAISIAALALIESLLCGASASKMKGEEFDANQEIIAQGVGNIIVPMFGGVPATAAIARTSVAIKSGAQTRLCGIIHALGLLVSMFLLAPVMAKIPLSALAGVLMVTAWRMNEWEEIKTIFSKKLIGGIVEFLATMIATIVFDLTIAIVIGIALSAIMYIFNSSKAGVEITEAEKDEIKVKIAYVKGPLFFANASKLEKELSVELNGQEKLIISLKEVNAIDTSGVTMLYEKLEHFTKDNVSVIICEASDKVLSMLEKMNIKGLLGDEGVVDTLDQALNKAKECN